MQQLDIIYRDDSLVAINKPPGLLVHRSPIDRRETRFALQLLRDQMGQRIYPLHRLDKPTSGVLLFALDAKIARDMMPIVAGGGLKKTYLAVVRGHAPDAGTIEHPLKEKYDSADPLKARPDKPAQQATTTFRLLAKTEWPWPVDPYPTARYSLLLCSPLTGRRHQLRRHLKHIGHPIIGDTTYGKGPHNRLFRERLAISRLLLHAWRVQFDHPAKQEQVLIEAPVDASFLQLERQGLSAATKNELP